MRGLLKALASFLVVDFFFFSSPYVFTFGYNTKELLAVAGLVFFVIDTYNRKDRDIPRELLVMVLFAVAFSIMVIYSTTVHHTGDTTYRTYFVSMLVWLAGAYGSLRLLKSIQGGLSVYLIARYIVYAAAAQGLVAVLADQYEPLDLLVNKICPGFEWVKSVDRLYGFSGTAFLDTGGVRFAIASVLCVHILKMRSKGLCNAGIPVFILLFCVITVTGNMVARTTVVGTIIGLVYLVVPAYNAYGVNRVKIACWTVLFAFTAFFTMSAISANNPEMDKRIRFGFEGFYSLVETGHWHTASNERLKGMYRWPDNPETWIIGDGYFVNPGGDSTYIGELTDGYYKDIDAGYLRFIYYVGLIGLSIFSAFIIYCGFVCYRKIPEHRFLFVLLTAIHFTIWLKVSTDCFFVFAIFLSYAYINHYLQSPEEEDLLPDN